MMEPKQASSNIKQKYVLQKMIFLIISIKINFLILCYINLIRYLWKEIDKWILFNNIRNELSDMTNSLTITTKRSVLLTSNTIAGHYPEPVLSTCHPHNQIASPKSISVLTCLSLSIFQMKADRSLVGVYQYFRGKYCRHLKSNYALKWRWCIPLKHR